MGWHVQALLPLVAQLARNAASQEYGTLTRAGRLKNRHGTDLGTVISDGDTCFLELATYEACCAPKPREDCWDEVHTAEKCCQGVAIAKPMAPRDDPFQCFGVGKLTYEFCCLPTPNPECWDEVYTPDKCCHASSSVQKINVPARLGNPECWVGALTFEGCCLPSPNQQCFSHDKYFTAEYCCKDRPELAEMSPLDRLHDELLTDVDPYSILNHVRFMPEDHYPDSHLTEDIIRGVLKLSSRLGQEVTLWMEVGSFLGGSAITTAAAFKKMKRTTGIVCMDPFTGDAGMWATRKAMRAIANHPMADSALKMDEYGHSRIYETFLANVRAKGHEDLIMPLRISSISGLRLLDKLRTDRRIDVVPQVIYLDSAHEEGETLLELKTAWELLPTPGILFGDDWSWAGVRIDVKSFATELNLVAFTDEELRLLDTTKTRSDQPHPGVALIDEHDGTWFMVKRAVGES